MDMVVNPNPAAFVIGGAGTFCPTGTTLTGQWVLSTLTSGEEAYSLRIH